MFAQTEVRNRYLLAASGLAAIANLMNQTDDPASVYVCSQILASILPIIQGMQVDMKKARTEILSSLPKGYNLKDEVDRLESDLNVIGFSIAQYRQALESADTSGAATILQEMSQISLCSDCSKPKQLPE